MTKAKNTKRALLASVLSMLLCLAMLVGSTFAWFTDSVTSGKNKIVAGNLDVELYHTNGNVKTEEQVGETTNLFVNADGSAIKWEPGVMVYENFTVKNVGSLALKYKLTLNADCNTVDGKSLADVLKVAILDEAFTDDRAAAQALTFDKTVADFEKDGNLAADEAGKAGNTYAIVIYWEPSANDNDYNFNNERKDLDPLYIDLGVNLFATQDTVENDSFDNTYDENAEYTAPSGGESDRPFTLNLTATNPADPDSEIKFNAETTETEEGSLFVASIDCLQPSNWKYNGCSFVFPIKGTSDKDVQLVFDFKSFKDVYAKAGTYRDYNGKQFQLVGDYWPVTVKIEHTKGDAIDFATFTGTLTELVKKLSESTVVLEAGTAYDEVFTVKVSWPFETAATEDCYILNYEDEKQEFMDLADTVIADWVGDSEAVGNELCAEFEVKFQEVH